jgi:hypothetical protein
VDAVLSSNDDDTAHPPELDALVDQKASDDDDVGVAGTTSAEAIVPRQIRVGVYGNPRPPVTDLIPMV